MARNGVRFCSQVYAAGETVSNYARDTKEADFVASFAAFLPSVGFGSYSVSNAASKKTTVSRSTKPVPNADIVLANEFLELTVSGATGRVSNLLNLVTGTEIALDQEFCTYTSSEGDAASGQKSGAYIFRPKDNSSCEPVAAGAVAVTAVIGSKGDLVQEVRQTFSDYLVQVIRLKAGARAAEFEFTVGEIPRPDPKANKTLEQCVAWRQTVNLVDATFLTQLLASVSYSVFAFPGQL